MTSLKKKILFTAYSLSLGGIEKALVNLLSILDKEKYDITLILERKEGIFLEQLPKHIQVEEYHVDDSKNVLLRKIKNRIHLWNWKRNNRNQFDFAISFATYSIPGAHLALAASPNNALWIHNNYYQLYDGNIEEMKQFFHRVQMEQFKHHVYVSYDNMNTVTKFLPQYKERSLVCNNMIDYETMRSQAKEELTITKEVPTFVNIGRHEEHQKRLLRIIEAAKRLVSDGYQFQVWLVGDGVDHAMYVEKVKTYGLENTILFLGQQKNPYPYYRVGDAVLLSSQYEGYPVVFVEAMTLNKPIITTKVSDYDEVIGKYGIVVSNDDYAIYEGMKEFLEHGYHIKNPFQPEAFNLKMKQIFETLVQSDNK